MPQDLDALAKTVLEGLGLTGSGAFDATVRPDVDALDRTAYAGGAEADPLTTLPRLSLGPHGQAVRGPLDAQVELEVGELLGEGGMGAVWLARQRSLRRDVAIKIPSGAPDAQIAAALLAEARVAGGLEHPHIVPIHVLGVDDESRPVLVMKRVEGVTLAALASDRSHPMWAGLLQRHGDAESTFLEVLMRVSDALEFAHARGIIHRDVKPENVMVGRFGEVYLLDWGVAYDPAVSSGGHGMVGTPSYMAPELVTGAPPDPRVDVYLLGSTLHAVLTGTARHDGRTMQEVFRSALDSTPIEYGGDVPPELAALCNQATAREPSERPASAAAFREALSRVLRHRALVKMATDIDDRLARTVGSATAPVELEAQAVVSALYEARYALAAVVREWEENEVALAVLERTLRAIVSAELERGNPDEAENASRELTRPDPELDARVGELRRRVAEGKRLASVGRREELENDPAPSLRALGSLVVVGALAMVAMMAMVGEEPELTMWTVAKYDAAFLVVVALASVFLRRRLLANRRGRTAASGLAVVLVGTSICDLFSAIAQLTPEQAAPFSLLMMALGLAAGGLASGQRFVFAGALVLVCATCALVWPTLAFAAVNAALLISIVASVSVMVSAAREARTATVQP